MVSLDCPAVTLAVCIVFFVFLFLWFSVFSPFVIGDDSDGNGDNGD